MGKREIPEVNAGSMADIAFLLLVFFLVTTTINRPETGIRSEVPEIQIEDVVSPLPPEPVFQRDLLMIYANSQNRLLIEKKEYSPEEVDQIYDLTLMFYDSHTRARAMDEDDINGDGETDFPIRWKVTTDSVNQKLSFWQQEFSYAQSTGESDVYLGFVQSMVDKWQFKLDVVKEIGVYYELPDVARIIFDTDDETDYGFYLSVLDKVKAAQKKLMNDFCQSRWQMTYDEMVDPSVDAKERAKHAGKVKIVKLLYPDSKLIDKSEGKIKEVEL